MNLNHVNIAVPHVAASRAFFEKFFGLHCTETKGDNTLSVLVGEEGFVLILSNFEKQVTPRYPRDFHLGFLLRDSIDRVDELYEQLRTSGIEANPPKKFHGSLGFYVVAPGGITVEVSSYPNEGFPSV